MILREYIKALQALPKVYHTLPVYCTHWDENKGTEYFEAEVPVMDDSKGRPKGSPDGKLLLLDG